MTYQRVPRAAHALPRARSVLTTSTVMAVTTGGLFFVSGILGLATAALMPDGPGSFAVVFGIAVAAMVIGIGLVAWGRQLRPLHHHALIVGGTLMLTAAVNESTSAIAAVALSAVYVSVAIDVCVFFSWRQAAAHVGFAVVCCMVVLAVRPDSPWWAGLVASGATVGVGVMVGLLSRFASETNVDALTGVPNRRGFDRVLNHEIALAARSGTGLALVVLNLDRFHAINEVHGYRAGDEALERTVQLWLPLLGPRDILARPGGDRFALVLPNSSEDDAVALTDRMRAIISMGCSAGVTSWQQGESVSLLVGRADMALYRAKLTGANRTVLESSHQTPLTVELADAIAAGDVEVLYQPIVRLRDETVVGVEALVRYAPSSRPELSTTEVIRVAEESGLIPQLDNFVLWRACLDAPSLQRAYGAGSFTLSVNVSGLELTSPEYVTSIADVLAETGWPPSQLVLEVTESVLDVDTPTAVATLRELRTLGIRIAIDDFGTGYSSLSRIQTMPADYLKLDRSFIATVTAGSATPPLLRAIAILGIALGLPVVAEGVEDEHQSAVVKSLGYSFAQGFFYGRPQLRTDVLEALGAPGSP